MYSSKREVGSSSRRVAEAEGLSLDEREEEEDDNLDEVVSDRSCSADAGLGFLLLLLSGVLLLLALPASGEPPLICQLPPLFHFCFFIRYEINVL